MKKIYFIIFSILLVTFIYWGFSNIIDALPKLMYSYNYALNETISSTSGSNLFKSTPENSDLINVMISLHTEFTNNPPILVEEPNSNVENFYKLEKFFPNFNSYYIAKLKIANSIYTELDNLYTSTINLSDIELDLYFKNNMDYLEQNWGIKSFFELNSLVNTIKNKSELKVKYCELEDSYFYSSSSNTLNFRIIVTLENNLELYIGALICFNENSDYQSYPVIRFYGTEGGLY